MSKNVAKDWRKEFGIDERKPPNFFSSKDELVPSIPQAHVLRRAFDLLNLDGILCTENFPLVYFKQLEEITADEVFQLHRQFWNHGGAPVLLLVSKDQVHVYTGMSRPVPNPEDQANLPSLVTIIDRVAEELREFLTSVESGEFFRQYASSFNPQNRVDRDLLKNLKDTREILVKKIRREAAHVLDALLCRLVFTCYLFDRYVIGRDYLAALGLKDASHLRDILGIQLEGNAKAALYRLFHQLGEDFNGDLFSDDLESEAELINDDHIHDLNDFFSGTSILSRQMSFWPYDFGIIPIETISAIYEHFLKETDQQSGAFYTPRFLAEIVLDTALEGYHSLLDKKFFDPACGSGIFLVGLFNRMAEEWKQSNPTARNDRRSKDLRRLLQSNLFGVDINPTACRITAFSLHLAYLDQLTPRDIQELQKKERLPRLITQSGNIWCADFFSDNKAFPTGVTLVVGNPPWGGTATQETAAGQWCAVNAKSIPDNQIAAAFVWKAVEHISADGHVCFVLPYGTLFNHKTTAVAFQKAWMSQHTVERVLNLADFRWFLFHKAVHPAIVVSYRKEKPATAEHQIDYWVPKTDWTVTQAEVITVSPMDRSVISIGDVIQDLNGPDAPQIWKQRFWGTPRDLRFLDRLCLYPRLRDYARTSRETDSDKRWIIAEGFQPFGKNDPERSRKSLSLPSRLFIPAESEMLDLFILERDCIQRPSSTVEVRRIIRNTNIFRAPHVLISKGFHSIAFADFDVSFQHAVRGVHGPIEDRSLLIFLAAYLCAPIAKYFMFHTASSWGIYRPEVHVEEVLRLPMPLPDQQPNPKRCWEIVKEVAKIVTAAGNQANEDLVDRVGIIRNANTAIEPLIEEYFDIHPLEKLLIEDTLKVIIPSVQPNQARMPVPTVQPSSEAQQEIYKNRVCDMLNKWSEEGQYMVRGKAFAAHSLGIGMVVLEKVPRTEAVLPMPANGEDILQSLDRLRKIVSHKHGTINPVRGLMVFDRNQLCVVKPIGQRHWTQTAALNDADEIASTILMHSAQERA